jgi:hypothetical protein
MIKLHGMLWCLLNDKCEQIAGPGFNLQIILCRVGVTYRTGFGLDGSIYCALYIHTDRDYRQYSAIAILHILQFTVVQALGFSAFTSGISATDLLQSHCHFKSHMNSSSNSLIPFVPFCSCQFRRLDSIHSRLLLLHSCSVLPNTSL